MAKFLRMISCIHHILLYLSEITICQPLPGGSNTIAVDNSIEYAIGSTFTYQCHYGYYYDGEKTTTCGIDGTWSLTPLPACTGEIC